MKIVIVVFLFQFISLFANSQPYSTNQSVEIYWEGKWFLGKILEVNKNNTYLVAYDGYGAEWNETVDATRLKAIAGEQNNNAFDSGQEIILRGKNEIKDVVASPDGSVLYAVQNTEILIIDAATLNIQKIIETPRADKYIQHLAINSKGDKLLLGSADGGCYLVNTSSFEILWEMPKACMVFHMAFVPNTNNACLVYSFKTSYQSQKAELWSFDENKKLADLYSGNMEHAAVAGVSINQKYVAISVAYTQQVLWFDATGKKIKEIKYKGDAGEITLVGETANIILADYKQKAAVLLNFETAKVQHTYAAINEFIYDLNTTADGKYLVLSGDGMGNLSAKVYLVDTGKLHADLGKERNGIALHLDQSSQQVFISFQTTGNMPGQALMAKYTW